MSALARQLDARTAAEEYALSWAEPADLNARCVIYLIVCWANGKGYVGQTRSWLEGRWKAHKANALDQRHRLARDMRKYGVERFSIFIIERCHAVDKLNDRETFWIKVLETSSDGYNIQLGGGVGWQGLPEVRQAMSRGQTGKVMPLKQRAKISEKLRGVPKNHSPETVELKREYGRRSKGKIWITNGDIEKYVHLTGDMPLGWRKGRCDAFKTKAIGRKSITPKGRARLSAAMTIRNRRSK